MIALHYLTERVQDPLLYIVTDMLTTLRRLYVYYPDAAQSILHTLRSFDGKVRGPASALASYLNKLGWEVSSNATLLGPGGLWVSLSGSSSTQIKAQVRIAWDWHCHKEVYHRKGVPTNPFDSLTTIRLMQTTKNFGTKSHVRMAIVRRNSNLVGHTRPTLPVVWPI